MNRPMQRGLCRGILLLVCLAAPAMGAGQAAGRDALNVSIPVFSTGVSDSASAYAELGVFPRVREIEARYLPFALRRQLAGTDSDAGRWDAVRVVADRNVIDELVIHGEILRSDGRLLEIRVRAVDATGTLWLDERYSAVPDPDAADPAYQRLFAQVAARLGEAQGERSPDELAHVREIALLRYGARLAPKTFGAYLEETPEGLVEARRLPAREDPMLDRITRIRQAEYVIIDAADEKYAALHEDVESIYDVWREFNQKSLGYEAQDETRIADATAPGPRGSYEALLHVYENYKYSRLTAEERDSMAVAFDNEVRPVLGRLDERLATYDAWLEGKYREWNRLLEELNELETRLTD